VPSGRLLIRTNGTRRAWAASEDWRAYDRAELARTMLDGGWTPDRITYANLVGSAWAASRGLRPRPPDPGRDGIPAASGRAAATVGTLSLQAEAAWLRAGRSVPWGQTLLAVAHQTR
jgi:hypothetical protein